MTTWQAVLSTSSRSSQTSDADGAIADSSIQTASGRTSGLGPLAHTVVAHAATAWTWLERKRTQQLASRRLRVAETISLGEKRFVSIVQVDGAQFLIGGAAGSVSLLAVLDKQQGAEVHNAARAEELGQVKR